MTDTNDTFETDERRDETTSDANTDTKENTQRLPNRHSYFSSKTYFSRRSYLKAAGTAAVSMGVIPVTADQASASEPLSNELRIEGLAGNGRVEYTITGTGAFAGDNFGSGRDTDGKTTGAINEGGTDVINYSGELTDFTAAKKVRTIVNGDEVSQGTIGGGGGGGGNALPNTIRIEGLSGNGRVEYTITGTGEFAGDNFGSGRDGDGGTTGAINEGGTDVINYSGNLTDFTAAKKVRTIVNGDEVSQGTIGGGGGGGGGGNGLPNAIQIEGLAGNGRVEYTITGTGAFAGDNFGSGRDTDGKTTGAINEGGTDVINYSGELTDFTAAKKIRTIVNGDEVSQGTIGGGGDGGGGGGGGGGNIPGTNPDDPPAKRASDAGFDIQTTKTVSDLGEIANGPSSNVLYIVDGAMTMDARTYQLGTVNDVAICGKNDARLVVPRRHRSYALACGGGEGIMWSGIDLDIRSDGSCSGLNFNVEDKGLVEYVEFLGKTGVPGYTGGPPSSEPEWVGDTRPVLHTPALTSDGTFEVRDIDLVSGGYMEEEHEWGVGPVGLFLAEKHKGTLRIKDSRFKDFPSDATYCTNTTGRVLCDNVTFDTNGTAGGRIARGHYKNCTAIFDYENSTLDGLEDTNNACVGLESEAKKGVSGVDVINCTVKMINCAKCAGGIRSRNINTPGNIGTIKNCDVHIGKGATQDVENPENAEDIIVDSGTEIGSITGCTFSGTADSGVSIRNNGSIGSHSGNSFDYPSGRQTGF